MACQVHRTIRPGLFLILLTFTGSCFVLTSEFKMNPDQNQPIDAFLASGHDLVHRICQGPLGCGMFKTKGSPRTATNKDKPAIDLPLEYYGEEEEVQETKITEMATTESSEKGHEDFSSTQSTFLETTEEMVESKEIVSTIEPYETGFPTVLETTTTESPNSIIEASDPLDDIVKRLCKGLTDCRNVTRLNSDHSDGNDDYTLILILSSTAITILTLLLLCGFACCVYKRRLITAQLREDDKEDEEADAFEFVDLSRYSPPTSPFSATTGSLLGYTTTTIIDDTVVQVTEL